ncbi:hypothetical protein C8Q77DRAFT_1227781, partial [Trametes polyzona]
AVRGDAPIGGFLYPVPHLHLDPGVQARPLPALYFEPMDGRNRHSDAFTRRDIPLSRCPAPGGHNNGPGGTWAYLKEQASDSSRNAEPVIYIVLTFLWDMFMTYRIFVVWNRKFVSLVVPAILLVGHAVATAYIADGLLWHEDSDMFDTLFDPKIHPRILGYFSVNLFTNVVMTFLLLGRLWWYDRQSKRYRTVRAAHSMHWRVMRTIMWSEGVYSLGLILNVVACGTLPDWVLVTSAMMPPLIGISFSMIIIRIGLSEALSNSGTGDNAQHPDRGRTVFGERVPVALPPIAVSVSISHRVDSEDVIVCDKSASACCDASSEDVPTREVDTIV